MVTSDRRGEGVAGFGLGISVVGFLALVFLGASKLSLATYAAGWHMLGAAGVWLLILVRLHQGRLLEQEKFELAELERERRERLGGAGTIFKEEDAEQMEALSMGRRLRTIERWFVPVFAMITAAFLAAFGSRFLGRFWPWSLALEAGDKPVIDASMLAFVAGGLAFVTFAMSRYALGMSRVVTAGDWTALRAGGVFFFGNSVVCLLLAISLVLSHNGYDWPERGLAVAIGIVMLVLAVEIVVNFVLEFYRPRVAGERQRVFYESRLLGVFCEPEGIIRSVAQTIDYQFGFKVSETWFYQLLGRAIVPLILFQAAILYFMTCFVVVPQGYQAVVEKTTFGTPQRWAAMPGIEFTWPWPFARSTLVPVERIRRLELGYDSAAEKKVAEATGIPQQKKRARDETVLWTQKHRVKEYQLLVADKNASAETKVPVNLLSVTMPVQWRVKKDKAVDFYRQSDDVEKLIECLAYRALTKYAAGADLLDLIGRGGIQATDEVKKLLQASCDTGGIDGGDLGVEIMFVGLGGLHPPTDVADAYETVMNALEQKVTKILEGERDAIVTQVSAGGEQYAKIAAAISAEEKSRNDGAKDVDEKSAEVEKMLRIAAGGTAGQIAAEGEAYFYRRVTLEGARAALFKIQSEACAKAPAVYSRRAYLRTMVDGLRNKRIYVVAVKQLDRILYQLDLKPPAPLEVLQSEVKSFSESGGQ